MRKFSKATYDEIVSIISKGKDSTTLAELDLLIKTKLYQNIDPFTEKIAELTILQLDVAKEIKLEADTLYSNTKTYTIIVLVFALILGIIIAVFITLNVRQILKDLNTETEKLTNAALKGELSIRGETQKINFEFREIVVGINKTLDAVINPLYVAADYVDKISKGEFPEKITENYYGDFNNIKNNLNLLISTFSEITDKIQKMAIGDLNIKFAKRSENDSMLESLSNLIDTQIFIVEKTMQISRGDLTIELKKRSDKDELLLALTEMVKALNYVVKEVKTASGNVATGSAEMSSTSQQMSQGASEQASSIEEVSTSIEQMTANIQQNSENAKLTEQIAIKAAKDIYEGNKSVDITVNAMKQIAHKIQIIGEIASKTDLLAINAAIEAARAGEHGKGFAVVANEVRKLAEKSSKAAAEIDELSKSSVLIAEKSGVLLKEIVPQIEKTAKLVQEIAAAGIEQSAGTNQMNIAITQLNQVAQINAASSEEMATSSEELSSQAEQLKEVIAFFKIEDESNIISKVTKHNSSKIDFKKVKPTNGDINKKNPIYNDEIDNKYEKF
jgi:methyl-accepting chemotaxis protein